MSISKIERVGIIGLGRMGRPMTRHLIGKGFAVTGFDVSDGAMAAAATLGAANAADPAEAARQSDLVIVVVGFDSEAEEVVLAPDGLLAGAREGTVIAISSTVAPGTMKRLAAKGEGSGVAFLDAPLCRGEAAAEEGKLLVMAGGDRDVFEACRPAFAAFADAIFHLGDLGAGQVGKMVNNLILWASISANYEGLKLGGELGVEEEPLRQALLQNSASNWALETWREERQMPWAEKDMTIVLREADAARISLPLCGVVKEVIKGIKIERGHPMPGAVKD